jgi:hypothetical protein
MLPRLRTTALKGLNQAANYNKKKLNFVSIKPSKSAKLNFNPLNEKGRNVKNYLYLKLDL